MGMPGRRDDRLDDPRDYDVRKQGDDIQTIREKRVQLEGYQYVSKIRKDAARFRAKSSKLLTRQRSIETKVAKLNQHAALLRRKSKVEMDHMHELEGQINEYNVRRKNADPVEADKLRVKVAKLETKKAKHQSKSSNYKAKAAVYSERADRLNMKSAQLAEESKKLEMEAEDLERRADSIENA